MDSFNRCIIRQLVAGKKTFNSFLGIEVVGDNATFEESFDYYSGIEKRKCKMYVHDERNMQRGIKNECGMQTADKQIFGKTLRTNSG